jgi:hypothetical protein
MNCRCNAVGLSLLALLALAPGAAWCQAKPASPLQLKFPASAGTAAPASLAHSHPITVANGVRRGPRFQQAEPSLSQRALQSLLDNADIESPAATAQDGATFRFERRGSAGRDLSQSYKAMCQRASEKLWDDPNGKRVKFDIAGKPGVAIEIPLR